jgi:hypothetical protein
VGQALSPANQFFHNFQTPRFQEIPASFSLPLNDATVRLNGPAFFPVMLSSKIFQLNLPCYHPLAVFLPPAWYSPSCYF